MPLVHYYQGRPASTWMTAMSRGTRAVSTSGRRHVRVQPASRHASAQRSAPEGSSTRAVVPASAWEAWAANWFIPYR
jgi:hypothetical protein